MEKILDMEKVQFIGKNQKWAKRPITTNEYKAFKEEIRVLTKAVNIPAPQEMLVQVRCYHDIDAIIQVLLDGMETRAFGNDRDV